jgi:hypothetical protein
LTSLGISGRCPIGISSARRRCWTGYDWTTRLALTLRAGAAGLPNLDGEQLLAANDYRLAPSLTLGVSIY